MKNTHTHTHRGRDEEGKKEGRGRGVGETHPNHRLIFEKTTKRKKERKK